MLIVGDVDTTRSLFKGKEIGVKGLYFLVDC